MAEKQIYQNGSVTITTSKVVVGGNTYFLRNIASVRVLKGANKAALMAAFIGVICLLTGLSDLKAHWFAGLIGCGLLWLAYFLGFHKHWLSFDTSSGAVRAYEAPRKNTQLCHELKVKIEEAMAERE